MFVEMLLTTTSVFGVIMYYWQDLNLIYEKINLKSSTKHMGKDDSKIEDLYQMPEGLNQIVRRLIKITLGIDSKYVIYCFWLMTTMFPFAVAVLTYGLITDVLRIALVIIVSVLPLTFLLARLQTLRIKSSKEGKLLIIDILDNYKIHYYNMQHAIEITASTIEEAPNCKKLLFNLSKGLNRVSGNEQIKSLLEEFKYAIGTSWAGVLTDNIYFALSSGIRVDVALEDLINAVAMAEEVEEKSKRENNEAGLILKYLVPVCYLFTFIGAIKFFGLTPREFFHYQFGTEAGISWFVAIVIMYISSLIAKFFLTQNKLDL